MRKGYLFAAVFIAAGPYFTACSGNGGGAQDAPPDRQEEDLLEADTKVDLPAEQTAEEPPDLPEDIPPEEEEEGIGPYGMVNAEFSTPFILDGELFLDPELGGAYAGEHPEAAVWGDSITGTYGSGMIIPSPAAVFTISYALHFQSDEPEAPEPIVMVFQDSCSNESCTIPANPLVRLFFPNDDIVPGIVAVDVVTEEDLLLILIDSTGTTGCVLAVGIGGTINVTDATDTTLPDGGTLALDGSDIPLYHPSDTPHGDLTSMFVSGGLQVCPAE